MEMINEWEKKDEAKVNVKFYKRNVPIIYELIMISG